MRQTTRCLELGKASNNLGLDTALVSTLADLEETIVSPVVVPAVGNNPVVGTTLNAPAENLDGMTTKSLARSVDVDTRLVGEEVAVDGEGTLDRAVGHNLSGNLVNTADTVGAAAKVLVVGVGDVVVLLARALAGWGGDDIAARRILARDVVIALGQAVRLATLVAIVLAACDDTSVAPVLPCSSRETTITAASAGESAAGEEILGRDVGLLSTLGSNADTISHGFDSTKCPAGTAVGLITDLVGGRADGTPLLARVKGGGQSVGNSNLLDGELNRGTFKQSAHLAADVAHGDIDEAGVDASSPADVLRVDLVGDVLKTEEIVSEVNRLEGNGRGQGHTGQDGKDSTHLSLLCVCVREISRR
eukprot:m.17250 g.17250  ORF g.17250 m.17250 type:complete len:362 (+) comp8245_c0_seq1:165-1250(+)